MEEKNIMNKRIGALIVAIAVLIVSVTGSTFAYFALTINNTTAVTGTTATVSLTLDVREQTLKTPNTGKMVPQLYSALGTAINNSNKCVDDNGNIVCKVYQITVTNASTAGAIVNGTIQFTNYSGTSNLRWRRIESATSLGTTTTGAFNQYGVQVVPGNTETTSRFDLTKAGTANSSEQYVSGSVCVPGNSDYNDNTHCTDINLGPVTNGTTTSPYNTQTYYIVVWLRETGSDQNAVDAGKTFEATIKFEGENGQGVTSTITS